jgi:uncharacterized protein (TIGR03083 family)
MLPTRIDRPEAKHLALEEFARFASLAAELKPDEWDLPTDCTRWDVRKVALHVLGSAEAQASVPELLHQLRRGLPLNKQIDSHHYVDGMNEQQIRDRQHLSDGEIVAGLAAVGPRAVKGRWGTPLPVRYLPVPFGPPIGWEPLKYLLDVGFTRDTWAHRIDVCVATGRDPELDAGHDGRLLGDIVTEWAGTHDEPFELTVTGPAGGTFTRGSGGEHVEIDGVELLRVLSGRRPGAGVLTHPLPL